jgi:hypothetical protein
LNAWLKLLYGKTCQFVKTFGDQLGEGSSPNIAAGGQNRRISIPNRTTPLFDERIGAALRDE